MRGSKTIFQGRKFAVVLEGLQSQIRNILQENELKFYIFISHFVPNSI